jgi:hypothetical protein
VKPSNEAIAETCLAGATAEPGVCVHLDRVVSSAAITVIEARFENPLDAPGHCPPATTQIHFHPGGCTTRVLFTFSARADTE